MKHYESLKFLLPEFQKYYYEEKSKYLIRAFAKDLLSKLSETVVSGSNHSYSSELTVYQIVPQDFHSTLFFKSFSGFLSIDKPDRKSINEKVKSKLDIV